MTLGTVPEGQTPREDQLERDEKFEGRRSILVAIDHGKPSLNALTFAVDHIITHHDRLHLVHVLPQDAAGDAKSMLRGQAQLLFDNLAKLAHQRGRKRVTFAMQYGEVGPEVCREAAKVKAILVVMGNRGLGRMKQFMVGSSTEHCIRHVGIPLVIVPHDYEPPVPLGGPSS